MSIRRGGNIVAGSVNKKEIVDLIENETRVVVKVIEGVFENNSSFISLSADDLKIKSQIISVNLGNTVILPNTYSLSSDGKTLNFVEQIEQGTKYAISYTKKFDIVGTEEFATQDDVSTSISEVRDDMSTLISEVRDDVSTEWSNTHTNCITEIPQDIKLELLSDVLYAWTGSGNPSIGEDTFTTTIYTTSATPVVGNVAYGSTDKQNSSKIVSVSSTTISIEDPYAWYSSYTRDSSKDVGNVTLVLKAGSKVYVPNGDGKFDEVTVNSDINYQGSDTVSVSRVVYYNKTTNGLLVIGSHSSGSTDTPNNTAGNCVHYNTTTNKIRLYTNGVVQSGELSLPLCIVKSDGKNIVGTIEQAFNGFGYIGSTVFALPGVKGLIPNGRNEDGSLKNYAYTAQNVITFERSLTGDNIPVFLRSNNTFAISTGLPYDEENNIIGTGGYFQVGNVNMNVGVISNFQPKTTFHAVDYNDKSTIVSWGMPDFSAGVSKSFDVQYTAECNGLLYVIDGHIGGTPKITINGKSFNVGLYSGNALCCQTISFMICKGDVYTYTSASKVNGVTGRSIVFYPCKGV